MNRSAYATIPAQSVECPKCQAKPWTRCTRIVRKHGFKFSEPLNRSHSERAELAATHRTAEVNPDPADTFEIPSEAPLPSSYPEPKIFAHHKVRT